MDPTRRVPLGVWQERRRRSDLETVAMLVLHHAIARDNINLQRRLQLLLTAYSEQTEDLLIMRQEYQTVFADNRRLLHALRSLRAYTRRLEARLDFPVRPRDLLADFELAESDSSSESDNELIDLTSP